MIRRSFAEGVDPVAAAVAEAHAAAGLLPGATGGAVVPLKQLIAAQPLVVDEVPGLKRETAAAHLLACTGQPVLADPRGADPLAGFLLANAFAGWILVERKDPLVRRRFSIAHELGHYLLHFLPLLERTSGEDDLEEVQLDEMLPPSGANDDTVTGPGTVAVRLDGAVGIADQASRMEEEADRFAAEVLIPEHVCRALFDDLGPRYGGRGDTLARRLASEFLVSQAAMRRRLADLDLL